MEIEAFRVGLGQAVKARRRAAKLSQEKLAEAVGYSPEWISRIERGVALPRLEMVPVLAQALGTSADQLLADVVGGTAQRPLLLRLMREAEELPDEALEVLIGLGESLRRRWPEG